MCHTCVLILTRVFVTDMNVQFSLSGFKIMQELLDWFQHNFLGGSGMDQALAMAKDKRGGDDSPLWIYSTLMSSKPV